ncbi:unnamed protein product [Nesidiocoris tenuis]|uniref:Uncharacterized protein n=1 Tax=Nesidiocoris tenuis TaxID=355587 RepID=A0A6H5GQE2_9HEMI|nr:unnamed protein product [Nesidiocoris tenuis]
MDIQVEIPTQFNWYLYDLMPNLPGCLRIHRLSASSSDALCSRIAEIRDDSSLNAVQGGPPVASILSRRITFGDFRTNLCIRCASSRKTTARHRQRPRPSSPSSSPTPTITIRPSQLTSTSSRSKRTSRETPESAVSEPSIRIWTSTRSCPILSYRRIRAS